MWRGAEVQRWEGCRARLGDLAAREEEVGLGLAVATSFARFLSRRMTCPELGQGCVESEGEERGGPTT